MTDWGAHHIDIAQWGIGVSWPGRDRRQGQVSRRRRTATTWPSTSSAVYRYADGVEMTVRDNGRNGIMFKGSEGRIFVNRGTLSGKPVEDLATTRCRASSSSSTPTTTSTGPPRAGKLDAIVNHMGNFFDCVRTRKQPISDVVSQHRSVTTCHLGNISMRLGRPLKWDPEKETFVGDDEANGWLRREQRKGYEIA